MRRGLAASWRRLPAPVRRAAHLAVGAVRSAGAAAAQAAAAAGQTLARRAALLRVELRARRWGPRAAGAPITVVGFHGAVHGLGEGARLLAAGLKDAGLAVRSLDLSADVGFSTPLPVPDPPPAAHERGLVISHINPPELLAWIARTEGRPLAGRRHVGYWAWELETLPAAWLPAFAYVDEVWCPSDFTAAAVRAAAPRRIKVRTAPYPIYLKPRPAPDRARFGLPPDRCVVLMAFDLKSTDARKNPQAALRAFAAAAARTDAQPLLVCKIVGADLYPDTLAALRAQTAALPQVRIMTDEISSEAMAVLLASCDVVLSLHRSEGYGLLMAEGMWAGKAVVATGWSSTAEFMDPAASLRVAHGFTPVADDGAIYRGGRWAQPDEADAADKLLALFDDPAYRQALGAAARRAPHPSFNRDAWIAGLRRALARRRWVSRG